MAPHLIKLCRNYVDMSQSSGTPACPWPAICFPFTFPLLRLVVDNPPWFMLKYNIPGEPGTGLHSVYVVLGVLFNRICAISVFTREVQKEEAYRNKPIRHFDDLISFSLSLHSYFVREWLRLRISDTAVTIEQACCLRQPRVRRLQGLRCKDAHRMSIVTKLEFPS